MCEQALHETSSQRCRTREVGPEVPRYAGDEIIVKGRRLGDEGRKDMITEVHGEGGAPPCLARWDEGHESVFMPSSDTWWSITLPVGPTDERMR
jgi:hypothetical protein